MTVSILTFLQQRAVSLSRLGQATGLDHDELLAQLEQPVATWSIQFLNNLAGILGEHPGQLLDQLQDPPFYLQLDDDHLTIQTIQFTSVAIYQQVRFAVESNMLEGWQPTKKEIRHLKAVAEHPQEKLLAEIDQLFGDDDDD